MKIKHILVFPAVFIFLAGSAYGQEQFSDTYLFTDSSGTYHLENKETAPASMVLSDSVVDLKNERKAVAKRLFRNFYGCKLTAFDDLVSDDFQISYPIFETLVGKPVLEGLKTVREFAEGVCRRWTDPEITIHETIAEDETAVLLWSYSARNAGTHLNGQSASGQTHSWVGITMYYFNREGKITAEFGEESDPGPAARIGYPPATPGKMPDAVTGLRATGTFAPNGPPVEQPKRTDAGNKCIVDLKQLYSINGTLSGSLEIDYRILLDGPCGEPIGTFDEEWIAYGVFNGMVNGQTASPANFSYTAKVRAGGDVEGHMVFSEGVKGELNIRGNFGDRHLSYSGWINQIKSDE